jgi:hypothetical protein
MLAMNRHLWYLEELVNKMRSKQINSPNNKYALFNRSYITEVYPIENNRIVYSCDLVNKVNNKSILSLSFDSSFCNGTFVENNGKTLYIFENVNKVYDCDNEKFI